MESRRACSVVNARKPFVPDENKAPPAAQTNIDAAAVRTQPLLAGGGGTGPAQ